MKKEQLLNKELKNLQKNCPIMFIHNQEKDILFSNVMMFQHDDILFACEKLKEVINPGINNNYYRIWLETKTKVPFRKWVIEQVFKDVYENNKLKFEKDYQFVRKSS